MAKKDRKAYQRELNRIEREEHARRVKMRKRITIAATTAIVAVALAGVGVWVYGMIAESHVGPGDMLSDGIQFVSTGTSSTASSNSITETNTDGIVAWGTPVATTNNFATTGRLDAQVYLDYSDNDSATFWSTNSSKLGTWIVSAYMNLEVHPIATDTSNEYAVRAVAAFGCVADGDPENAWAVNSALLAATATAEKDDTTLSVDGLSSIVANAGVTNTDVLACVSNGTFVNWAKAASERAAQSTLYGDNAAIATVPTLTAAGLTFDGDIDDADALVTFLSEEAVNAAIAEAGLGSDNASPSASPSASLSTSQDASSSASPSASE